VTEQNVERHRRAVTAFNAGDTETFIAYCDSSVEWSSAFSVPGGAVYQGHDGLRRWLEDIDDAWGDEARLEPEAYFDLGEYTIAFHVLHGRGRRSGIQLSTPQAHVARWRDGLIVYFRAYLSREEALEDFGVSEDALEPIAP
jgi:ketosteroid isomerase-like protein